MKYFGQLVKPLEQLGYKLYSVYPESDAIPDIRTIDENRYVGYLVYTKGGVIELYDCRVKEIQLLIGLLT